MAEDNVNEHPERPTRMVTEFPETIGKVIQSIQVYVTADHLSDKLSVVQLANPQEIEDLFIQIIQNLNI